MTAAIPPTVLVTGASGTVGTQVRAHLDARACTVRALVRTPDADDEQEVRFDFEKPETWGQAFDSGDRLFLVRPPSISRVGEFLLPAIDAAQRCGIEHVTLLSVLGAEKNPLLPHRRIERHLEASGLDYTFLRASFFMQNFDEVHARDIREHDELFVPAGGGKTSFVDARDVAEVAAVTLTDDGHRNRAYDVTGPEALGYDETAAIFSDVLGRDISYPRPGAVAFARRWLARGEPLGFVVVMLAIYTTARLGLASRVTHDVREVLDRDPRPLQTYVADYKDAFEESDT
ncbi:SDR family oxidoreductase [Salinibaculum salinum]|uniref:SDR family oxidoreductase n=1 Tax=Salinibaculum salinum TaxID=3131996 RepID=UPI0030EE4BD6